MEKLVADVLGEKIGDAFQAIIDNNKGENIVTSPLSLLSSFAVLTQGLTGNSFKEIATAFGLGDNTPVDDKLMETISSIIEGRNEEITIKLDNCLFTNRNIKIKPDYIEAIKKKYHASAESLDFCDPKTVKIINDRIIESTDGMVTNAVQKLNSTAFAILVNTMYFYGEWDQPFSEDSTMPRTFYKSDGSKIEAMFMFKPFTRVSIIDRENEDYAYLAISYKSERTKFIIEMAKDGNLKKSNSARVLETILSPKIDADIYVPKFKASFKCDLVPVLKSMGISKLFSASKEFKGITDHQMCISCIYHNACIEVDEIGTKMTLFTVAVMEGEISCGLKIPKFIVDKPFFFHIVDCDSKVILFSGAIEEPIFN